ncbi:toxin-antitoxin system YwqK family antitoxin [Flavobacterium chungangense]|uniref:hypothetical protein n=1 Tax=Flavobacterium chungangense TaxID=554283 RepID=UPI0004DECC61|nr:hypothetical protein [Flavobacterium chungangense]
MKNPLIPFVLIFVICISCTTVNFPKHPQWLCSKKYACLKHPRYEEPIKSEFVGFYDSSINDKVYEDFPYEDTTFDNVEYRNSIREGKIINGFKEGLWQSAIVKYDTITKTKEVERLFTKEYFKHGLRDSIFKQYDINGKIIYETMFKMGTGLWKEFHANGKTYFEAYTQDGYFTDTLKLYNREGVNFEKRFYQKDTLVYYVGNDNWCLKYRYKPDNDTYLEVDSYNQKDLKQGTFRNTFRYKTKEEFEDDYFARNTLKR